jgi:hypothetical protein
MPITNAEGLLQALLGATTPEAVRNILEEVGDFANAELDEPFGPFQFCWHAYGDNQSNISSIGLATKPGRSLTERLTNAMDAILEGRAGPNIVPPNSPRDAARQWFGRPVSGPEDGLFNWDYAEHDYDDRIAVVLSDSGEKSAPTVDVLDEGIGLTPERFPGTILSLQARNKIDKWYVIGAFGQGGASTLAFADYVVIVSRHKDNPRVVGFTVIRVLRLSGRYKEDCYAYLCLKDASGAISVPSCQLDDAPLTLYPGRGDKAPKLHKGTLVRHVAYKLPKLEGSLSPSPGNLYTYLHISAFDPLLPFRVIDLRGASVNNQLVTGSRNRLMKLAQEGVPEVTGEDSGSELRHHRSMEFFAPHGTQDLCVGIEYWVVLNYKKGRLKKGSTTEREPPQLRSNSNELYIQRNFPIVGTLNGQNQGELSAQLFRDAKLGMVARHVVVHIDATRADSRVRRELFSTSREGFKDGPVLTSLTSMLEKMVEEDQTLYDIERELTERIAREESETTSAEVKRRVQRLLLAAGLQLKQEGPSNVPGGQETTTTQESRKGRHRKAQPLPTKPFPEVTKFVIVVPKPKMQVRIDDSEMVLVETDADSEFDRRGLVAIRAEPSCLELAGKVPLNGGRVRWRLRPRQTANAGDVGKIIVTLTKPDGTQMADVTEFEVLPALEQKTKKAKGYVPPFKIVPINPDDNPQEWALAWPDLTEGAASDDLAAVAYRPLPVGGGITVYYSTVFAPFHAQVEKFTTESAALAQLFRTNYEVWIAYHAILQENGRSDAREPVDDEVMERLLEADRSRVARMQVEQAKETAQLMHRAMRDQGAPAEA